MARRNPDKKGKLHSFLKPLQAVRDLLRRADDVLERFSDRIERVLRSGYHGLRGMTVPVGRLCRNYGRLFFEWSSARLGCLIQMLTPYVTRYCILGLFTLVAALASWRFWLTPSAEWVAPWVHDPVFRDALQDRQLLAWLSATHALAGWLAVLQGVTAIAAVVWHRRLTLLLLKISVAGAAALWLFAARLAAGIPAALHAATSDLYTTGMRNADWAASWWWLVPTALAIAAYALFVAMGNTRQAYTAGHSVDTWADRTLRDLLSHGHDPRFRRAQYRSLAWHILVILILPFLLFWLRLMESPYELPKGSGQPVVEMVRIREVERVPRDRFLLNPDSAISFYVPEIDDSRVFDEVDDMTMHMHEASDLGALGDGGGTTGGWPDGMENARVRFIRLEYDGGDWDHNMGHGYDYNMLLRFRDLTGFDIWPETESIAINRLRHFPKGRAPPFVYLTGGMRGALRVSEAEVQTLRHYCLEMGGMIFADNAGGRFDAQFRNLVRRAFPELPFVEIPNDDIIFRQPYVFPQGAPPLWHHSGMRAMGVRHRGRWVVFYHQGELSDAWRDGHSGISRGLAMRAYRMGVNVIYYAFTQYMRLNHPRR